MLASPSSKWKNPLVAYVMDREPGLFAKLSGHANPHWFALTDGVWGTVEESRPHLCGGRSWTFDPWGEEPRTISWGDNLVFEDGAKWWTHPRTVWGAWLFEQSLIVLDDEGV
jgi:hypothetical protein